MSINSDFVGNQLINRKQSRCAGFGKSRPSKRCQHGFTLVEMFMAVGISTLIIAGVIGSFLVCTKNMLSVSNYDKMSQSDQLAIDRMTREIRGLGGLTNFAAVNFTNAAYPGVNLITNSTTFYPVGSVSSNDWITFAYDPTHQVLARWQSRTNSVCLSNCVYLNFSLYQRNQSNGTFVPIPTTNAAMVKIVQVAWDCSAIGVLGTVQNDSVKSAEVVMRCK